MNEKQLILEIVLLLIARLLRTEMNGGPIQEGELQTEPWLPKERPVPDLLALSVALDQLDRGDVAGAAETLGHEETTA